MQSGRPPQLADRDDLWRLLVTITENKARDQIKQQRRQKRGAGQTRGDSVFQESEFPRGGIDQNVGAEPTPEFTAQAIEECRRLLGMLGDPQLEQIVLLKMEGFTREEIAQQLNCVPETIGRKLRLIRTTWSQGADL
jgi:DNA-directed RNA polymerase specialized sigma24 family protein